MAEQTFYQEGQTATSKDGTQRVVFRNGMWVKDTSFVPQKQAANTTVQDRTALNEASARAAAERDALRTYSEAARAVEQMGTGPIKGRFLDMILPDQDGGILDTLGAVIGTPARALVSPKTIAARDHLNTVNANVALAGASQMKGAASDKDVALMRLSGLGPNKTVAENKRIIRQATYSAGLEQARALLKSRWIAQYGSLSAPSKNGMTFEQALQIAEREYDDLQKGRKKRLPKAPPAKRGGGQITIDLNGNPIR